MAERIDHAAVAEAQLLQIEKESGGTLSEAGALAFAQVHATLALVEKQRIANKLVVAHIDQLTQQVLVQTGPGYPVDPAIQIRPYLPEAEWAELGL